MKTATDITLVVVCSIAIIVHVLRILYLIFKPRFLATYRSISSTALSGWELGLYYTLALLTTAKLLLGKLTVLSRLFD